MTDERKLLTLIEHYANGNKGVFADMLDLPRSTITTWLFRGAITAKGRERILDTFPELNRDWLLRDARNMITPPSDTLEMPREDAIPYYGELPGTCGVVEQFDNPEIATDRIYLPGVHACAALPASGDSMYPTIQDGDTVVVDNAIEFSHIKSGNIYLICTREGQRMFKRLELNAATPRYVVAISDNPDYSPRALMLEKRSLAGIYPALNVVRKL